MWNDLTNDLAAARSGGTAPAFARLVGNGGSIGVYANRFSDGEDLHFVCQVSHAYAEGTVFKPHIHWLPDVAMLAGETINWTLEYAWCNVNDVLQAATVLDPITYTAPGAGVGAKTQLLTSFSDIAGASKRISSIFIARISRVAGGSYAGEAWVLAFDIHMQLDTAGGSINITSKP